MIFYWCSEQACWHKYYWKLRNVVQFDTFYVKHAMNLLTNLSFQESLIKFSKFGYNIRFNQEFIWLLVSISENNFRLTIIIFFLLILFKSYYNLFIKTKYPIYLHPSSECTYKVSCKFRLTWQRSPCVPSWVYISIVLIVILLFPKL